MALQFTLKNSSVSGKEPLAAQLANGELALNYNADGPFLTCKDTDGAVRRLTGVWVNANPPASPTAGELWLDISGAEPDFNVWDGSAWHSAGGSYVNVDGDVMTGALGVPTGASDTPSIYFSGSTTTGLYSTGADQVAISTNGTGRLFVDSSGQVGLGTSSPSAPLDIGVSSSGTYALFDDDTNARFVFSGDTSRAILATATTGFGAYEDFEIRSAATIFKNSSTNELARITSSGQLLVGTSTGAATGGTAIPTIQLVGTSSAPRIGALGLNATPWFVLARTTSTSIGTYSAIGTDNQIGRLIFAGDDGTDYQTIGAEITAVAELAWTTNDAPTRLVFSTCASGASSPTERMRITNAGSVGINSTSPLTTLECRGQFSISDNATSYWVLDRDDSDGRLKLLDSSTSTNERLAIDSSGRLLVGTSTASGSAKLQVAGDITATGDATVGSLNGGPLAGTRNRIINGDMRIAQRGTSFAVLNGYSLDRWFFGSSGAMVCTISQDADVPNSTFQSSLKVDVTTADTSIAGGDVAQLIQRIEGYNVRDLIGTTFTLSFWVKSPKTGTHCVSFRNQSIDRSYVKEYTVSAANTWEYKTLTVVGGLITAGTWNWTNGTGLDVCFTLASGTTYQTTADAWQTGNFIATANQVNVMDSTANDFYITGVQLEPGTVATPFERRSYGQELSLCQRYYYEDAPLVGTGFGVNDIARATALHPVGMRAAPAVTVSNSVEFFNGAAALTATGAITNYSTSKYLNLDINISGGGTSSACCGRVANTGKITVNAEL